MIKVEVDVSEDTFTVFLRHLYGSKLDVEKVTELEFGVLQSCVPICARGVEGDFGGESGQSVD